MTPRGPRGQRSAAPGGVPGRLDDLCRWRDLPGTRVSRARPDGRGALLRKHCGRLEADAGHRDRQRQGGRGEPHHLYPPTRAGRPIERGPAEPSTRQAIHSGSGATVASTSHLVWVMPVDDRRMTLTQSTSWSIYLHIRRRPGFIRMWTTTLSCSRVSPRTGRVRSRVLPQRVKARFLPRRSPLRHHPRRRCHLHTQPHVRPGDDHPRGDRCHRAGCGLCIARNLSVATSAAPIQHDRSETESDPSTA